jgi:hypothetical protein
MRPVIAIAALLAAALSPAPPAAAQTVAGYAVTTYSTLPGPVGLAFDGAGVLYVGQDAPGSGAVSEQFVRRVPAGGGAPADYGPFALPDPRGVFVDVPPAFASEAGAVIVTGPVNGTSGQVVAILPSESTQQVGFDVQTLNAAGSGDAVAPSYVARGANGLLILDAAQKAILQLTPAPALSLAPLVTHTETPRSVAIGPGDEIFVSYDTAIRRYSAAGVELLPTFAEGLDGPLPLAFSPGGDFPAGLYAIETGAGPATGRLLHFATDGTFEEVGTGFPSNLGEIEFDAQGALYVASFAAGQVLRVGLPEPPPPPADLGPYVCYGAKSASGSPWAKQDQTLTDVFGPIDVRVGKPKALCNPAEVSGGPIPAPVPNGDPDTRIASHQLAAGKLAPQPFDVTNALFSHAVTTLSAGADRVFVPSSVAAGAPPALPASSAVDSFQCYKAKLAQGEAFTKTDVTVEDTVGTQTVSRTLTVKKPKHLCIPAAISGLDEPVGRPDGLLVCYAVKLAKGESKTPVLSGLRVRNVLDSEYTVDVVGSQTTTSSATRSGRVAGDEIETFVDEGRTRPGEWDLTDSEGPRWAGGGPLAEDAESLKVTFSDALGLGDEVVRRWRIFVEIDIAVNDTNAGPGVVMRANGIPGIPDGTQARAMAHGKPAGLRVSSAFFTPPSGTTLSALVEGDGETTPELVFEANGDDSAGAFAFQIKRFGVEYEAVVPSQTVRAGTPEVELCLPSTTP